MISAFASLRCRPRDRAQTFTFAREIYTATALIALALCSPTSNAADFVIYDFDDTLMRLPTENYAFIRGEHGRVPQPRLFPIISSELPLLRDEIGRAGTPLERFEIVGDDRDPVRGSFQNARPGLNGENPFDRDLARALTLPQAERESPLYREWIARESTETLRPFTRILTGRGNAAHEMHAAFHRLEALHPGFRAPPATRIIPVGGRGKTADRKAEEMQPLLREAARLGATRIIFADDDIRNLEKSLDVLLSRQFPTPSARRLILVREHDTVTFDFRVSDDREDLLRRLREAAARPADAAALARQHQLKASALCRALFF